MGWTYWSAHIQHSLFPLIHSPTSFYPNNHQETSLPGGASGHCKWGGTRRRWQGGRLTQPRPHDGGPTQRPPGAGSGYSSSPPPDRRPCCRRGEERRGEERRGEERRGEERRVRRRQQEMTFQQNSEGDQHQNKNMCSKTQSEINNTLSLTPPPVLLLLSQGKNCSTLSSVLN